jgi:hypothetical protein
MSSAGSDEARLASGATLGATISGFETGDAVDFEAVNFASGDAVVYSSGEVFIENAAHVAIASLDVNGTFTAANFALSNDGSGHLLVSYAAAPARRSDRSSGRPTQWRLRVGFLAAPRFGGGDPRRRIRLPPRGKRRKRARRLGRRLGRLDRPRARA